MAINIVPGVGPSNSDIAAAVAAPSASTIASAVAAAVPTNTSITNIVQGYSATPSSLNRMQILTNSQTWTHPDNPSSNNPKWVEVILSGGGGGGGSGAAAAMTSPTVGGSGGGGSGIAVQGYYPVTGTVTVTIGAGGAGGAAVTQSGGTTERVGLNGSNGGVTSFGNLSSAGGTGGYRGQDPAVPPQSFNTNFISTYGAGGSGGGHPASFVYGGSFGNSGVGNQTLSPSTPGVGFWVTPGGYVINTASYAAYGPGINTKQINYNSTNAVIQLHQELHPFAIYQSGGGAGSAGLGATTGQGNGGAGMMGNGGNGGFANFSGRATTNISANAGNAGGLAAGGGGGGTAWTSNTLTATSGAGGAGGSGYVIVRY